MKEQGLTVNLELDTSEFEKQMQRVGEQMQKATTRISTEMKNALEMASIYNRATQGKCEAKEYEPENVKQFREITEQMLATYKAKNSDYGSSVEDLHSEYGDVTLAVRLGDKYNRFKTLIKGGTRKVKDETIIDTLLDLANYAIISIIILRNKKK